ncbi:MAG: hypothetical protein K2J86_10680, partial [Prevotella sp.]|nr:hypothetical protein [Prevotella sp.]
TFVDNIGRTSGGGHDNLTIAILETKINSKLRPKMSKQTKIIILGLIALLVVSISMNIMQCGGTIGEDNTIVNDSLKQMKDSVVQQNEQIETIKRSIAEIDKQIGLISVGNIAPVDSIKKIIEKSK